MLTEILSIVAVAGAWVAGLGIVFAVLSFTFGTLRPALLKAGIVYLVVTDIGIIVMLAALLGIINSNELWWASLIGLVTLVGFTIAAVIIVRDAGRTLPTPAKVLEVARRRIEF